MKNMIVLLWWVINLAKLFFRYGAMNCGKSTALMQVAHNYEERGLKILVLKPKVDTKADDKISSRIGLERKVDHLIVDNEDLYEYILQNKGINCVIVDEAQFLNPKQVEELLQVAVLEDIPVICYGLRTDFQTKGFPGATRLLELAHSLEEMKTICRCGSKAMFNARKVNDTFVFDGEQVAIDGKDLVTYESLCCKCYYEERAKSLTKKKNFRI